MIKYIFVFKKLIFYFLLKNGTILLDDLICYSLFSTELKRLTINLCVLKDGTKLPRVVILDRMTLPKTRIPELKLIVAANGFYWVNYKTLEIWVKKTQKSQITMPP